MALLEKLGPEQADRFKAIPTARSAYGERAPAFDLKLIQRYVVKRAFSLGWTAKRFDHFDTNVISYRGREAAKAERIGKKYQWIAYHEVCALVADNFQFRAERRTAERTGVYDGPWQDFFRDIDPSHSLLATSGDFESDAAWWSAPLQPNWGEDVDGAVWAKDTSDFPRPEELWTRRDTEGRAWIVAKLYLNGNRPVPEGFEREDGESRNLWCQMRAFLIRNEDVAAFLNWADGVDFWGKWMPEVPSSHGMFLGEYHWSPAWKHFRTAYYENEGWVQPGNDCPVQLRAASFEYHQESGGFDCSAGKGFTLYLPDEELADALGLNWSGAGGDFLGPDGQLGSTDPSAFASGPGAHLIRRELIEKLTQTKGLTLCWMILGEKLGYFSGAMRRTGASHASGACALKDGRFQGFLHFIDDDREKPLQDAIFQTRRF